VAGRIPLLIRGRKVGVALLWQTGRPQRIAESFRERSGTVHASKLAAVAKVWLQFEYSPSSCHRFVDSSEFGKRSGQVHVRDAVCRICLNGLVGDATSFFVTPAQQMAHCLRVNAAQAQESKGLSRIPCSLRSIARSASPPTRG
jgi:hypothetical protein